MFQAMRGRPRAPAPRDPCTRITHSGARAAEVAPCPEHACTSECSRATAGYTAVLELRMTESLTRFDLPQSAIPTRWYNIQADLPRPLPPGAAPRAPSSRSDPRTSPAVPDGADQAGGQPRALHRHPGGGPRDLQAVAPDPAAARAPAGEGARDHRPHLLQVRGRLAERQPQAQHRRPAGLLQQARGRAGRHHRDRRRPVGHRDLAGL
jgi:hypothetical protein